MPTLSAAVYLPPLQTEHGAARTRIIHASTDLRIPPTVCVPDGLKSARIRVNPFSKELSALARRGIAASPRSSQ
jgi:hypothetical protein